MKNLKKTAAVLTAAAMAMTMGMTAYAENNITTEGGSDSAFVKGTYVKGDPSDTVYRVDITWGDMAFTYNAGDAGSWDPATHKYSQEGTGSWSGSSEIVITNHSNAALNANVTFAKADNIGGTIIGRFFGSDAENSISLPLEDASGTAYYGNFDTAPSASTTLTMDGNPSEFADGNIGTVTVAIVNAQ